MTPKRLSIVAGLIVAVVLALVGVKHWGTAPPPAKPVSIAVAPALVTNAFTNSPAVVIKPLPKFKRKAMELSDDEKAEFLDSFEKRYKPALAHWCKAFDGHVPFSPDSVTPDNFVERVGKNMTYRENIFVVDGVTLGIQDSHGVARVDYLNDPHQTRQMESLPNGAVAPVLATPVNRTDVIAMLYAESGTQYMPNDVRLIPSGFSGSLNGGVLVQVGGDPENSASWHYDMAFGADGKLGYFLNAIHK